MKPLRAARERVARARALLLQPSPANLEFCARSLESARVLLGSATAGAPAARAEALALCTDLKAASALARRAAAFYLQCVHIAGNGCREYTPRGLPSAAHSARLLGQG